MAYILGFMVAKRLGIVGGLGPETSSKFCLEINRRFRELTGSQPNLVLENVPVPISLEKDIINGHDSREMLKLLTEAVIHLNKNVVDLIAIPCNSVHIFIENLRSVSAKPILSIIEECAKKCQETGIRKIGLLATQKTIDEKLFFNEFINLGVEIIIPSSDDQMEINEIILRIINGTVKEGDKEELLEIIGDFKKDGVEGVILGCTDLSLLLSGNDCSIAVFDTCRILQEASILKMLE